MAPLMTCADNPQFHQMRISSLMREHTQNLEVYNKVPSLDQGFNMFTGLKSIVLRISSLRARPSISDPANLGESLQEFLRGHLVTLTQSYANDITTLRSALPQVGLKLRDSVRILRRHAITFVSRSCLPHCPSKRAVDGPLVCTSSFSRRPEECSSSLCSNDSWWLPG